MSMMMVPKNIPTETAGSTAYSKVSMIDTEGKVPMSTLFGELTVGMRRDDISLQFQYNISTRDVEIITSGTGVTGHGLAMAEAHSGTGVGSTAISSKDALRYRPGHEALAMFTTVYESSEVGVDQKHGLYNDNDGLAFGYQGTDFGVWFKEGGNETFTKQSDWSDDKAAWLNPSKSNIYKISFGWLGIAPIFFSVYAGHAKGWVLLHVIDRVNLDTEPHLQNPSLPLRMEVTRASGTGSNIVLYSSSWRAGVIGGAEEDNAANRVFSTDRLSAAVGAGVETPILALKNKTLFQGINNHTKGELMIVRFSTDGTKDVAFRGYKGGTGLDGTYVDVESDNSAWQVNKTPTVYTPPASQGASTVLGKIDALRADVRGTGLVVYPGEEFVITAESVNSTVVSLSVRWSEYF